MVPNIGCIMGRRIDDLLTGRGKVEAAVAGSARLIILRERRHGNQNFESLGQEGKRLHGRWEWQISLCLQLMVKNNFLRRLGCRKPDDDKEERMEDPIAVSSHSEMRRIISRL